MPISPYTASEQFTIRTLFIRYIHARGYVTDEGHIEATRLASAVAANGGRGDKGHLTRLADQDADFPGLSLLTARALLDVLHFGDIERGRDRDNGLRESDVDSWISATHLRQFVESVRDREIDARGRSIIRGRIERLQNPIATGSLLTLWMYGRFKGLRFDNPNAEPLLQRALERALEQDAPDEFTGIIHHDLSGANMALGNLHAMEEHTREAERLYSQMSLIRNQRPNVKVGLARATARRLNLASWRGESDVSLLEWRRRVEERAQSVSTRRDERGVSIPVPDYYSLCEATLTLAYHRLVEEKLTEAAELALEGYAQARKILRGYLGDLYWQLRDGISIGAEWLTLHALALNADLWVLTEDGAAHDPGRALFASPEDILSTLDYHTPFRWWVPLIPPFVPLYQWKIELLSGQKTRDQIKDDQLARMARMESLQAIMYQGLALIATGDFFREVDPGPGGENATFWYEKARRLAVDYGYGSREQLAIRRLASVD